MARIPYKRAFYSAEVPQFMADSGAVIEAALTDGHVGAGYDLNPQQHMAWSAEVRLLRGALDATASGGWGVALEFSLLRLGKRIDAVLVGPGLIILVEFKIGGKAFTAADRRQVEGYALRLREFHEYAQSRVIAPVLCVEHAEAPGVAATLSDGVTSTLLAGALSLKTVITKVVEEFGDSTDVPDLSGFLASPYRPTPTIVEAARSLYAGHHIDEIGRSDAEAADLAAARDAVRQVVADAEERRDHVLCFVTGTPGAGKTLLGLDLALSEGPTHGALLSGNRPLVYVLSESLARDSKERNGGTLDGARLKVQGAIQNLLGYLKEHTEAAPPPEHVLVFDEAQRAWDAKVGARLMGRPKSEPEHFLDILSRLDWCCLVCLVGPGQEINQGEGGLALWGQAIAAKLSGGDPWQVVASTEALTGTLAGSSLSDGWPAAGESAIVNDALHLDGALRTYRNSRQVKWVDELLRGDLDAAGRTAAQMGSPPAVVTRELETARAWLRHQARGDLVAGLLTSADNVRITAEGVAPAPTSRELGRIAHWFLAPREDYRSASALEIPMSEYGCQGLEIDYAGLFWGPDLVWINEWSPRKLLGTRWNTVRSATNRRFALNAYRVLLTRARLGTVIFVPQGAEGDVTRNPSELASVVEALLTAGCALLEKDTETA